MMVDHKNKLKNVELMNGYYVFEVISIPYPRYGVFINTVSKENIAYLITISDIPLCICHDFINMSIQPLERKKYECIANIFTYV